MRLRRSLVWGGLLSAAVLLGGCAAKGRPAPTPTVLPPAPPAAAWAGGAVATRTTAILETALGLVGTPYRDGGSDVEGFDCSGFVQFVFGRHGLRLGRTVASQFQEGVAVVTSDIRPGDLLFFTTTASGPTHVALALADRRFVHAPSGRGVVRVESFDGRYWPSRFVGARRVLDEPLAPSGQRRWGPGRQP
jgi:cell wall-associated NlpC family hydrolase